MVKIIAALLVFFLAIIKIYIAHKHGLVSAGFGLPGNEFKRHEKLPFLLFTGLWVIVAIVGAVGFAVLVVHGAEQVQISQTATFTQSDLVAGVICVLLLLNIVKHGHWLIQKNSA